VAVVLDLIQTLVVLTVVLVAVALVVLVFINIIVVVLEFLDKETTAALVGSTMVVGVVVLGQRVVMAVLEPLAALAVLALMSLFSLVGQPS
jgi:hypothetical protein